MKIFKDVLDIIGLSVLVALSGFMCFFAITAHVTGNYVVLDFNHYHEGLFEAIFFSLATIFGSIAVFKYIRYIAKRK